MTKLLERAFEQASKLPAEEQNELARAVLEELAAEHRWSELFGASGDMLLEMAGKARAEHRAGRTRRLDPDKM